MSDNRTQAPTKRRRQLARERGLVPRSPELTAAAVLMAATLLMGSWGGRLASGLLDQARGGWSPIESTADVPSSPEQVAAQIRAAILPVVAPMAVVLAGAALAGLAAHQAQVGGLFAPSLLAPDPGRLWASALVFDDLGGRSMRGGWSIAKAGVVAAVAVVGLRSRAGAIQALGGMEASTMLAAAGELARSLLFDVALALVALGVVDFWLQYRRIEALLRTTPEDLREDQKAVDGDPAVRARRRQLADARRLDPAEAVRGAKLVVTGGGLTVVLSGGPPPSRPIRLSAVGRGLAGRRLRIEAEAVGRPILDDPELARALARSRTAAPSGRLARRLADAWPPRLPSPPG